ncbi:hypothetical protein EPO15_18230 [bacterium]|nr:MAG: hypothetical protein EPO15_18230 [bacterium]
MSCADRMLCACLGLRESEVRAAVRAQSLFELADLVAKTEAGAGCTCCHPDLKALLQDERERAGYLSEPICSAR